MAFKYKFDRVNILNINYSFISYFISLIILYLLIRNICIPVVNLTILMYSNIFLIGLMS